MTKAQLAMTNVDLLLQHYAVAGPRIERALGPIPFVWSTLPGGLDGPTIYHGPLSPKTRPKAPVVDVPTASGLHRYPALSADRIEGLVRYGAVEIYSWTPSRDDVRSAIEYLANPLIGLVERDPTDGSIVVLSAGGDRVP